MRWRILLLLITARLSLGLQFQTMGSTSEYIIADFQISYAEIGTLIGLFMLPGLFLAIPAGFAGRWASDRLLSTLGLACVAGGGVVSALANTTFQIGVGRFICGAGFVLTTIYFTKMITDWFAGREIATALGALVMTWPLGIAIGQILHEWLASYSGWHAAFWLAASYAGMSMLLIAVFYRQPVQTAIGDKSVTVNKLSQAELCLILPASLVWAFFNAGFIVYLSFAPKLLTVGGMTAIAAAATISVASYLMMGTGIVAGVLSDRTGKPDLILYLCVVAAIVSLLALQDVSFALLSSLVFGFGMAPAGIIVALSGQAMRPGNRALGMGVYFSAYFLVVAPAATIAGWLFDRSGNAFYPIIFAAILFALTAISNVFFRWLQRRAPLGN